MVSMVSCANYSSVAFRHTPIIKTRIHIRWGWYEALVAIYRVPHKELTPS